ncbi:hypothetical protein Tco_0804125 [Tanacetum coccineum]|uniref:Uncharacterized protein n=1 Tax=Tanacetum coccineum TaxID=301880 RepID=A0ABQ5A4E9_9ASTR
MYIHGCKLLEMRCEEHDRLIGQSQFVTHTISSWLRDHATLLARFIGEPSSVKSTVQKQLQSSVGPMQILGAFRKIHLQKNILRVVDDADLLVMATIIHDIQSISVVRSVGMPISAEMTASVSYVGENGVSPLLDLIIVRVGLIGPLGSSLLIQSLLLASSRALFLL